MWSIATWALSLLLGLPLTVLLVRLMPTREYGSLTIATAVIGLLSPLAALGLAPGLSSIGASALADSSDAYERIVAAARRAIAITSVALVPVGLVVAFALWSVGTLHRATLPFLILLPGLLMIPFRDASLGLLQAEFRPGRTFFGGVVGSLSLLALTSFVLISGGRSADAIAVARCIAFAAGAIILVSGVKWNRLRRVSKAETWSVVRFGLALVVSVTLSQTISQLDIFSLGAFKGPSAVASYAPVSKLADMSTTMVGVLGTFLVPALTVALAKQDVAEAVALYHWASRWALVFAAPLVGILAAAPVQTFDLLFGLRSHSLVTPARVLAFGIFINVVLGFNWLFLVATKNVRAIVALSLLGLVVSVVCCASLIGPLGATGAAIATSSSLICANIGASLFLFRRYGMTPFDRSLVITQVVALLACASSFGLAGLNRSFAVPVVGGVVLLSTATASFVVAGSSERSAVVKQMKEMRSRVAL